MMVTGDLDRALVPVARRPIVFGLFASFVDCCAQYQKVLVNLTNTWQLYVMLQDVDVHCAAWYAPHPTCMWFRRTSTWVRALTSLQHQVETTGDDYTWSGIWPKPPGRIVLLSFPQFKLRIVVSKFGWSWPICGPQFHPTNPARRGTVQQQVAHAFTGSLQPPGAAQGNPSAGWMELEDVWTSYDLHQLTST